MELHVNISGQILVSSSTIPRDKTLLYNIGILQVWGGGGQENCRWSPINGQSDFVMYENLCALKAGKYPWMVVFQYSGKPPGGCAGTLVAAEWVVTAAHCLRMSSGDSTKDNLLLILGEFDISSSSDSADIKR